MRGELAGLALSGGIHCRFETYVVSQRVKRKGGGTEIGAATIFCGALVLGSQQVVGPQRTETWTRATSRVESFPLVHNRKAGVGVSIQCNWLHKTVFATSSNHRLGPASLLFLASRDGFSNREFHKRSARVIHARITAASAGRSGARSLALTAVVHDAEDSRPVQV
jgi:hypothetical protein